MKHLFIALFSLLLGLLTITSAIAQNYTFDQQRKESLDGCMAFTRNFGTQGELEDKQSFQEQFGMPIQANTPYDVDDESVTIYNFDNYTRIVLDCQSGQCHCRCYPRY